MPTFRNLVLVITFLGILLNAKNLVHISSHQLNNFELLDVYIHNDLAFIPGGLRGLNIVDISVPSNPQVLGSYHASGCDWGRIYAWAVGGHYAYGTGRECGIHIIDISSVSEPNFVAAYSDANQDNVRYEHPFISGSLLFAARHQDGVEVLSLANPANPIQLSVIPIDNAWATLAVDDKLYIADGGSGIKITDISNPSEPIILASASTSGTAKDLALSEPYLFVAVGASGVDMFDISNPANPILISNYNTSGYASRIAVNDSLVVVSDWDDVEVLGYTSGELTLKGFKNSGGRVMAVGLIDNTIFSAEWRRFNIFNYQPIAGPDVDYSRRKIEFPRVLAGGTQNIVVSMSNTGNQLLSVLNVQQSNSDFSIHLPQTDLTPGETIDITITYSPNGGQWRTSAILETNDPDEPTTDLKILGNFPSGPMVGDPAPDFTLPLVNGIGSLSLADLGGAPAIIAFFTSW